MTMTLREITWETLHDVLRLKVKPEQEKFVATNAVSIAEAHFHTAAWIRAIYAGDTPAGFVMLHDENLRDKPEKRDFYSLWRFMIDAEHQGKGYGGPGDRAGGRAREVKPERHRVADELRAWRR